MSYVFYAFLYLYLPLLFFKNKQITKKNLSWVQKFEKNKDRLYLRCIGFINFDKTVYVINFANF
jgi:hypothetical protein